MICDFCASLWPIFLPSSAQSGILGFAETVSLPEIIPNRKHYRCQNAPNRGLALCVYLPGAYYEKAVYFPIAPLPAFNIDQCRLWTRASATRRYWLSNKYYADGVDNSHATFESSGPWWCELSGQSSTRTATGTTTNPTGRSRFRRHHSC